MIKLAEKMGQFGTRQKKDVEKAKLELVKI